METKKDFVWGHLALTFISILTGLGFYLVGQALGDNLLILLSFYIMAWSALALLGSMLVMIFEEK